LAKAAARSFALGFTNDPPPEDGGGGGGGGGGCEVPPPTEGRTGAAGARPGKEGGAGRPLLDAEGIGGGAGALEGVGGFMLGFEGIAGFGFAPTGGLGGGALSARKERTDMSEKAEKSYPSLKVNIPSTEEGRLVAGEEEFVLGVEVPFSSSAA